MKKTSKEWADLILHEGEYILDPDGWDRKNFHHSYEVEEITLEEFRNRLVVSTVMMNFFDVQQRINNVLAG